MNGGDTLSAQHDVAIQTSDFRLMTDLYPIRHFGHLVLPLTNMKCRVGKECKVRVKLNG